MEIFRDLLIKRSFSITSQIKYIVVLNRVMSQDATSIDDLDLKVLRKLNRRITDVLEARVQSGMSLNDALYETFDGELHVYLLGSPQELLLKSDICRLFSIHNRLFRVGTAIMLGLLVGIAAALYFNAYTISAWCAGYILISTIWLAPLTKLYLTEKLL